MNPAELFSKEPNPIHLGVGEVLFRAGEPGDAMFVVLEGTLDIMVSDHIIAKAIRGDIVGEMALIDQSPRSATVTAMEAATLVRLDAARFQKLIQYNPYFAMHVMKVLADRIRRSDHGYAKE